MFTQESRSGSILKVWGVPDIGTQDIREAAEDMISAVKNSFRTTVPLFVIFPDSHSKPRLPFILMEYQETVGHSERTAGELESLAAQLGYIAKKHFPGIYIQCDISSRYPDRVEHCSWNSTHRVATRENVERIHEGFKQNIPNLEKEALEKCYCASNRADHKGPCSHHNRLTICRQLLKEGEEILSMPEDSIGFRARADIYMGRQVTV